MLLRCHEYDPSEAHPRIARAEKRQVLQATKDSCGVLSRDFYQRSLKKKKQNSLVFPGGWQMVSKHLKPCPWGH